MLAAAGSMLFTLKLPARAMEEGLSLPLIPSAKNCYIVLLTLLIRFVEFETAADLRTAVEKLDGREFKNQRVNCIADVCHSVSLRS